MNCKRAKTQLALLIGSDLEPHAAHEVRQHLEQCTGCRNHFNQLSTCLEALQVPVEEVWSPEGGSLWQKLSVRIGPRAAPEKPHRLNGWAATVTVAAACTGMFWIASRQFSDPASSSLPVPGIETQRISQPAPFSGLRESRDFDRRQPSLDDEDMDQAPQRSTPKAIPVIPVHETPAGS